MIMIMKNLAVTVTVAVLAASYTSTAVDGFTTVSVAATSKQRASASASASAVLPLLAQKKSPRFSQDAHQQKETSINKSNTNTKNNSNSNSKAKQPVSEADAFFRRREDVPREPLKQSTSPRQQGANKATTTTTTATTNTNTIQANTHQNNNKHMWKTTKSIEQLEENMTTRWGTMAQAWTADPNEYEFVYDDDDSSNKEAATTNTFRGKPVKDPWQQQDNAVTEQPTTTVFGGSKEDAVMNRVRRNQEKLLLDKTPRPNKIAKWKDLVEKDEIEDEDDDEDSNDNDEDDYDDDDNDEDEYNNDDEDEDYEQDIQGEFYDQDDEGFEFDNQGDDEEVAVASRLFAPKPVAPITKERAPWEAPPAPWQSGDQETKSPGFFFNPGAASTNINNDMTINDNSKETTTKKATRKESQQIRDKDGNPLYLTLDQAKQFFHAGGNTDENSEDGQDDEARSSSWHELGISSPQLLRNLQAMNCPAPLSVQDKACPTILTGNDVLVGTYTGSGKTLAFLVPLIQRLLVLDEPTDGIQVLIVAPGRELASQIVSVARELLVGTDMTTMLAIGGTTFTRNLEQIRKKKPTIIVGTPGRIAELIVGKAGEKRGRLPLASLKSIVLDEFDALLEYKPHRDPTAALVQVLKNRHRDSLQSILCSATASDMMGSVKLDAFLRPGYITAMADMNDKLVTGGATTTRVSKTVIHGVIHVAQKRLALDAIRRILHTEPIPQQVLIFADTARRVDILIDKLDELGIVAAPLHGGDKSEKMDRAEVSKALREGFVGLVVATELAARGLDAPLLTHVINLDLPTDASHYAHRAGRCGRGGRPGVVINITTGPKERNVPQRFASTLGVKMHTVELKNGKLNLVDPLTIDLDPPQDR